MKVNRNDLQVYESMCLDGIIVVKFQLVRQRERERKQNGRNNRKNHNKATKPKEKKILQRKYKRIHNIKEIHIEL